MFKRVVLLLSAMTMLAAVFALPAGAAGKKLFTCGTGGQTPGGVSQIRARGLSCQDARAVIRSVEGHKQFCRPQKGTIAPYRICNQAVVLSGGTTRTFHCVARFVAEPNFREICTAPGGVRVQYIRNFNNTSR